MHQRRRGWLIAAAPGLRRDGTGSGSWSCRPGCIRAAASLVALAAATTHQHAARLERDRPCPHTRPRAQAAPPACRPARSAFFGQSIGIADAHHTVLALAHRDAGFAPGAALLPTQAARMQRAPDRERADLRQPIRSVAQGFLQQAQRPGGRAVLLALGRAGPFGQDALLRLSAIADPWSAPMARPHGGEPVAVEAAHPDGDGLIVPSSDLVGGRRIACAISNGQERSGALGSARARSTCAAGALSERLRRVNSWRSSAVSGRRGSFWWRDMAHLGTRGSPHPYTTSHGKRPTGAGENNHISFGRRPRGPIKTRTPAIEWVEERHGRSDTASGFLGSTASCIRSSGSKEMGLRSLFCRHSHWTSSLRVALPLFAWIERVGAEI